MAGLARRGGGFGSGRWCFSAGTAQADRCGRAPGPPAGTAHTTFATLVVGDPGFGGSGRSVPTSPQVGGRPRPASRRSRRWSTSDAGIVKQSGDGARGIAEPCLPRGRTGCGCTTALSSKRSGSGPRESMVSPVGRSPAGPRCVRWLGWRAAAADSAPADGASRLERRALTGAEGLLDHRRGWHTPPSQPLLSETLGSVARSRQRAAIR